MEFVGVQQLTRVQKKDFMMALSRAMSAQRMRGVTPAIQLRIRQMGDPALLERLYSFRDSLFAVEGKKTVGAVFVRPEEARFKEMLGGNVESTPHPTHKGRVLLRQTEPPFEERIAHPFVQEVHFFFVVPEMQRKGIGTQLVEESIERARNAGFVRLNFVDPMEQTKRILQRVADAKKVPLTVITQFGPTPEQHIFHLQPMPLHLTAPEWENPPEPVRKRMELVEKRWALRGKQGRRGVQK